MLGAEGAYGCTVHGDELSHRVGDTCGGEKVVVDLCTGGTAVVEAADALSDADKAGIGRRVEVREILP